MKRFLSPLLFLLPALLAAQESRDCRILSADADGVTIEYTPELGQKTISAQGKKWTVFTFDGAEMKPLTSAGTPDTRLRRLMVGLPGLAGATIQVVRTEYHDAGGIDLAPVPDWKKNDDGEYVPVYSFRSGAAASGFLPAEIATLEKPGIARDRIVSSLLLFPAQWNPATRTARLYTRIVVRVQFGPRDPRLTLRAPSQAEHAALVNDAQSAAWRIAPRRPAKKLGASTMAAGDWYRIEISEDGIYKLPKSWFDQTGINTANLDPRTIKLYGCGGRELPLDINAPRPENLQELAIEVPGEADGKFDASDYVLFYGQGLTGFTYDSASQRYRHYIHRFDAVNSYLLTFGGAPGKRIAARASLADPNPARPSSFIGKAFVEEEKVNLIHSGRLWLGPKIAAGTGSGSNSMVYTMKLDQLVPGLPVTIRTELYSRANYGTANSIAIDDNGTALCTVPMGNVNLATDRDDIAWQSPVAECAIPPGLPDGRSNLRFTYIADNPDQTDGAYVDWVEWYYPHAFAPTSDILFFSAPDTSAAVEYAINGYSSSDVSVYDVTDFTNVARIADPFVSGGTVRFQSRGRRGAPSQFVSLTSAAWKTPAAGTKVPNSGLLSSVGASFVIITAPEMVPAANALKAWRERDGEDKISTLVTTTQEIYDEFNSGVTDPVAIRNFLAWAFQNWGTPPEYVLLLGDGHYDYLLHTTSERIWVPVFETENSINLIESYVTDDFYAQIAGNDDVVDLKIGRIPAGSPDEAMDAVNKIILYETGQSRLPWRNTITFVADDGPTTTGDDGSLHTGQAEDLARSIPEEFEQKKIYILAYKTVYTSEGRRKPEANQAIIDQINAGTVITNFTGHGNESVWTHERVLVADVSIPKMENKDRLSFLCAATCAFGLYDAPDLRSGAEMMVVKPDGAMIGALAAPRVVFSQENSNFNSRYLHYLINAGRGPDGRALRVADATFYTKQELHGAAGYEKFALLCDPTVRLAFPRYKGVIDQILVNDKPAIGDTVQLKALSKAQFRASVRRPDGSVWSDFNGVSFASLFDANRSIPVPEWGNWSYIMPGGLLYRGQVSVQNGQFTVTFIVPKDITYENNPGRFSLYFENANADGLVYSTKLRVSGSETDTSGAKKPPRLDLFLDSRSFRPGDVVNENALLLVDIADDYGVNTTGNGVGHNIEGWLDDNPASFVLNDYYSSKIDSYQEGTVEYPMHDLAPGRHTLKVRAWNIYNISGMAETQFEVATSASLALRDVYTFPNPMKNETSFTFLHNLSEPVDVTIRIYTVAGRLVKKIEKRNLPDRFIQIPWDGRDEDGDLMGNGLYFYRLNVTAEGGSKGSEVVEKLAIVR